MKTPVGILLVLIVAFGLFELPYLWERKRAREDLDKIKEKIRRLKGE